MKMDREKKLKSRREYEKAKQDAAVAFACFSISDTSNSFLFWAILLLRTWLHVSLTAPSRARPTLIIISILFIYSSFLISFHSLIHSWFINNLLFIYQASRATGDRVWRMPLYKQYRKQMDSHIADINNVGTRGRMAGSCTAAAFLKVCHYRYSWYINMIVTWLSGVKRPMKKSHEFVNVNFYRNLLISLNGLI